MGQTSGASGGLAMVGAPREAGSSQDPASALTGGTPVQWAWSERVGADTVPERGHWEGWVCAQEKLVGLALQFCGDNCFPRLKR